MPVPPEFPVRSQLESGNFVEKEEGIAKNVPF